VLALDLGTMAAALLCQPAMRTEVLSVIKTEVLEPAVVV
jgi:hypothetical protein